MKRINFKEQVYVKDLTEDLQKINNFKEDYSFRLSESGHKQFVPLFVASPISSGNIIDINKSIDSLQSVNKKHQKSVDSLLIILGW